MTDPTEAQFTSEQLTEAFEYLDELRESGRTNMFGAPAYVENELGWERQDARTVTGLWMDTFTPDTALEDRVSAVVQ